MTIWRSDLPLVLASQSSSRRTLLQNAGLSFDTIPADLDERAVERSSLSKAPGDIAALLAREKAACVARLHPERLVIGADQTLSLGGRLFNKPADVAAAKNQLRALAGQVHELHSAVAVVRNNDLLFSHVAVARMTMRRLSDDQISAYLESAGDAVTASVGAYQLERLGVHLFERIEGDHFTILGLPLLPLLAFLRREHLLTI
jgi:septum formation protein